MNYFILISAIIISIIESQTFEIPIIDFTTKEITITKKRYKNKKEKFYFYNGEQMWYIKKYKPNKKQKTRITNNMESDILRKIYTLEKSSFEKIEEDLNAITHGCDFGTPYIVKITDTNGRKDEFTLKQFKDCYPDSSKEVMELFEKLFGDK